MTHGLSEVWRLTVNSGRLDPTVYCRSNSSSRHRSSPYWYCLGQQRPAVWVLTTYNQCHVLPALCRLVHRRHRDCVVIRPTDIRQDDRSLIPIRYDGTDLVQDGWTTCRWTNNLLQPIWQALRHASCWSHWLGPQEHMGGRVWQCPVSPIYYASSLLIHPRLVGGKQHPQQHVIWCEAFVVSGIAARLFQHSHSPVLTVWRTADRVAQTRQHHHLVARPSSCCSEYFVARNIDVLTGYGLLQPCLRNASYIDTVFTHHCLQLVYLLWKSATYVSIKEARDVLFMGWYNYPYMRLSFMPSIISLWSLSHWRLYNRWHSTADNGRYRAWFSLIVAAVMVAISHHRRRFVAWVICQHFVVVDVVNGAASKMDQK